MTVNYRAAYVVGYIQRHPSTILHSFRSSSIYVKAVRVHIYNGGHVRARDQPQEQARFCEQFWQLTFSSSSSSPSSSPFFIVVVSGGGVQKHLSIAIEVPGTFCALILVSPPDSPRLYLICIKTWSFLLRKWLPHTTISSTLAIWSYREQRS
ncbi:hypothetical protein E2C01_092263 [Portunus trituberculatus]|uniref:Uncharacterized protein n=1 Tax=Portunus trituberculatus TaxID=210409 RepID=A0A5B7JVC1_PORTR|nr:hypothetical protein [Portunus trituberculatus]